MIYNLIQFGTAFQGIRKSNGYSYNSLSDTSGIAKNTLRNIERGRVTPNLDTLSHLSTFLRVDLTGLLLKCKTDVYTQYDDLLKRFERQEARHSDRFISEYVKEAEALLGSMYDSHEPERMFKKVLQLYYKIIGYYEVRVKGDSAMAEIFYCKALNVTIPDFDCRHYDKYSFSYEELHILFNLVQLRDYIAEDDYYLTMYHFIYDVYSELVEKEIYMFPTLVNNLAVAYLNRQNLDMALKFANIGLSFINKEQSNIDMPALILCKGLILHYLGDDYGQFYIDLSFDLLIISNRTDIIELALRELKTRHNIDYKLKTQPLTKV